MVDALDITVKGIVQGVGFRPFVYRMAKKYLINGWVLNAGDGVKIHAEGESKLVDEFVLEITDNAPAAAQVQEVDLKEVPLDFCEGFEIRTSDTAEVEKTTLVSPDLATCDACLDELHNPNDRRYHYPFINCTNCGPRFTIIDHLPYDRSATSMAAFTMDERCAREYADPLDRRFHAQPNACFTCGPTIFWSIRREGTDQTIDVPADESIPESICQSAESHGFLPPVAGRDREASDRIFTEAAAALAAGKILAVKGLGGFHLVCDAANACAVAVLRERKHREGKPFAIMMRTVAEASRVCAINPAETGQLTSPARPIVLLRKKPEAPAWPGVADRLSELGIMLPATPVQTLLLEAFINARSADGPAALIMTSGNATDEPIVIDDAEAFEKLGAIADGVLGNNRPIRTRFDDSVLRVISAGEAGDAVQMIRRARGFAPTPLTIPAGDQSSVILGTGPEQKVTFTLLRGGEAFVSQHIGDMENADAYDAWLTALHRFETLFELTPNALACDLHPEYLTSKWAHEQPLALTEVQHHHAHIVSLLAEHGATDAICGVAFDGTGYGVDGAIWGGEVLLANQSHFERFANFAYVPMPGGAAAIRHPRAMAYGVLWAFDLLDHPGAAGLLNALGDQAALYEKMIHQGVNTPYTSSVGRLFDAASALLDICTEPRYEGEAAVLLEATIDAPAEDHAADESPRKPSHEEEDLLAAERYGISVIKNTATAASTAEDTSVLLLDAAPTFTALLDDYAAGIDLPTIARRFHTAFANAIVMAAELVASLYDIKTVGLSGGVFMNRHLIEATITALQDAGFTVLLHKELPPNDGCISLGQAVVAWARTTMEEE